MCYTQIQEKVNITLSFAVLVIDDFTDKRISFVSIFLNGCRKNPIQKTEGYYIFTNIIEKQITILIEAVNYKTETRNIDLTDILQYSIIRVRLKPEKTYSFPKNTTYLEGKGIAFSQIRLLCYQNIKYFKLCYDYSVAEDANSIRIYSPERLDLEGKKFGIVEKKTNRYEYFTILEKKREQQETYLLERKLERDYKKMGTCIYSVLETTADKEGYFFLPIKEMIQEKEACMFEMEFLGGIEKRELLLNGGCINQYKERI